MKSEIINGKGDKPRPVNFKLYQTNYLKINWGKNCKDKKEIKIAISKPYEIK